MANQDGYDHLRESADAAPVVEPKPKFILVDQINGQAFGLFDSIEAANNAARTGAESVGGVPWGEDGWEVVSLQQFKADLQDEGIPDADYIDVGNVELNRSAVIDEIGEDIDSGNAHLMTRNELAEFIDWWINLDSELNANEVIYQSMEGNASVVDYQKIAKEFFVHKDYER